MLHVISDIEKYSPSYLDYLSFSTAFIVAISETVIRDIIAGYPGNLILIHYFWPLFE